MAKGEGLSALLLQKGSPHAVQKGDMFLDGGSGFGKTALGLSCVLDASGMLPARVFSVEHYGRYVDVAKCIHREVGKDYHWAKLVEDGGIHEVRPSPPLSRQHRTHSATWPVHGPSMGLLWAFHGPSIALPLSGTLPLPDAGDQRGAGPLAGDGARS